MEAKNKSNLDIVREMKDAEVNTAKNAAKIKALAILRAADKSNYTSIAQAKRYNVVEKLAEHINDGKELLEVLEAGKFTTKSNIETFKRLKGL